jgi:hypothetical protein
MPRISEFFGVLIYMYYNDHAPPHFHAEYGGREAHYMKSKLCVSTRVGFRAEFIT